MFLTAIIKFVCNRFTSMLKALCKSCQLSSACLLLICGALSRGKNSVLSFLQPKDKGKVLYDEVYNNLNLEECEYFGLNFYDRNDNLVSS